MDSVRRRATDSAVERGNVFVCGEDKIAGHMRGRVFGTAFVKRFAPDDFVQWYSVASEPETEVDSFLRGLCYTLRQHYVIHAKDCR